MMPHLVRDQSTYKDIRIHSFHHTHTHTTNTCINARATMMYLRVIQMSSNHK